MKKILSLLSIIALTLGTAPTATAQYTVMASTDAVVGGDQAVRYEYYIKQPRNQQLSFGLNDELYLRNSNNGGGKTLKLIFKQSSDTEYPYAVYGSYGTTTDAKLTANNDFALKFSTDDNIQTINIKLSETTDKNNHKGNNFYSYYNNNNYIWRDATSSGVKLDQTFNKTGLFYNWIFIPAAPAPMIFSNSAKHESKLYATYSTGVATTIPDGVTAYTATYNATEGKLTLSEVSGTIIPVNTGVLLALDANTTNANITVNENGKTVVYPEESKETTTLENTGFQPSCTSDNNTGPLTVASEEGSTAYILGVGKTHGLGFYKLSDENRTMDCYKAYLKVTSPTSEEAIKLEFPNSTGISTATTGTKADTPVYDLSGRKVTKTSKGNIYIQNGKKLLAK